ncbi:MAG TPA: sigma factor-like helix-turn-helix DNA-binding protein [Terriglobales bacterium]
MGTAVARINRELPLTKPAAVDTTEGPLAKGKYETFQALVMQALQLRRAHREVFILCDIRGYSAAETASILDISEESVVRRLARARSEMGFDGEDGASAITELVDF